MRLIIILTMIIFSSHFIAPAAASPKSTHNRIKKEKIRKKGIPGEGSDLQQIASFKSKKNALTFAKELKNDRINGIIRKGIISDKKIVYRVYAKKTGRLSQYLASSAGRKSREAKTSYHVSSVGQPAKPMKGMLSASELKKRPARPSRTAGAVGAASTANTAIAGDGSNARQMTDATETTATTEYMVESPPEASGERVVTQLLPSDAAGAEQEQPLPSEKMRTYSSTPPDSQDAGLSRGLVRYFNPSLTITEVYTDNAYNTNTNKKSDWSTYIVPSFNFQLPFLHLQHAEIEDSSTRAPSGLLLDRRTPESFTRYDLSVKYQPIFPVISQNSPSGNMISHKLDGIFLYNFRGGVSFSLADEFLRSYDTRSKIQGEVNEVDKYMSNLADAILTYDAGARLQLRGDYSYYFVDYDAERNSFRNHHDNAYSLYLFYKIQPKTALFLQYSFINIDHDFTAPADSATFDSKEHHYLVGIDWDITAKSSGRISAGYGTKDFENSEQFRDFIYEAQITHRFTPKTSVIFKAFRKTQETDLETFLFMLSNGATMSYQQMMTRKITAAIDLLYEIDRYEGNQGVLIGFPDRKDYVYQAGVRFQYAFRRWLRTDIGYSFTRTDSNIPVYSYSTNTFSFGLTGSL